MNERPNEQREESGGNPGKTKKRERRNQIKNSNNTGLSRSERLRGMIANRFDLLNRFRHWYLGGISITRSMFRVKAAWQGVIIICAILGGMYVVSAFYTGAGEFVISLDSNMSQDGFYLSNTLDFSEKTVCVRSEAVVADNVSIFDIDKDVGAVDGMHSGDSYVAHTFYVTNETGEAKDYKYSLNIRQSAKQAEKALWVMVYYNGKQKIYAMEQEDGTPEAQYSVFSFPFEEDAEDVTQYQKATGEESGISTDDFNKAESIVTANKLVAVPFETEKVICSGQREQIGDNQADKYTVVMWYEGEDPDCTDKMLGGWVELYMEFEYLTEE